MKLILTNDNKKRDYEHKDNNSLRLNILDKSLLLICSIMRNFSQKAKNLKSPETMEVRR